MLGSKTCRPPYLYAPVLLILDASSFDKVPKPSVARFLECQGLLERDAENSYLVTDALPGGSMDQLLGHSITYRIAVGPQAGRKVFA